MLKSKLLNHKTAAAFFAGWLAVAALPPYHWFVVLFVCFPLLLWLSEQAGNFKSSFKLGYAFGFAYYAFGLAWIGNAVLIDAASFGWLYPLILLGCGAFFGLFTALPLALSSFCSKHYARWLAFGAWWTLFEWIRSWFLTGFPWNLLGTVLAFNNELIQTAAWGGTYFLSLLVILTASSPYLFWSAGCKKQLIYLISLLSIYGLLYLYGYYRLHAAEQTESTTTVRIVQPAIPQAQKWDKDALASNFQNYINLSRLPGQDDADFIIWGETATPYALDMDNYALEEIKTAIPTHGYLITGLVRYRFDGTRYIPYNSMFVLDKQGNIRGQYDKSHLVPFGEYIPLKKHLPAWIKPVVNVIGEFGAGNGPEKISLPDQPSLGTLICYEVIFPSQIIDPHNKPQWIVNLTNDGWYGDSSGPRQHLASTRLRAVEEGITIVRAANTGISALISPYGEIKRRLDLNQRGVVDFKLPLVAEFSTTYGRYGNSIILILCTFILCLAYGACRQQHS